MSRRTDPPETRSSHRFARPALRRSLLFPLLLAVAAALVGCSFTPAGPTGDTVRVPITAADGGVVDHPDGATLTIPAGALSRDAEVAITSLGYPDPAPADDYGLIDPFDPLLLLSRTFEIDLGGADALTDLRLELDYASPLGPGIRSSGFFPENLVLRTRDANGAPWLRSVDVDSARQRIARAVREEFGDGEQSLVGTFVAVYSPVEILPIRLPILQVPYYWQDARPWCGPTSLAMVVNTHAGGVAGIVSNWYLAGKLGQDQDAGAWPHDLLAAAGAPGDLYDYYHWDADLIPNGSFTEYVERYSQGFNLQDLFGPVLDLGFVQIPIPDVDVPPRPVNLSSTTTNHAFVAVGSTDVGVWLHDPSGAFTGVPGIASWVTWPQFRATALDLTRSDELYTLILTNGLRSESERRGSIVLYENGPATTDADGSLFVSNGSTPISRWQWDGDPYDAGGYWDDPYGQLPDDADYGNAILVGARMEGFVGYRVNVANVTDAQRDYVLGVALLDGAATVLDSQSHSLSVTAHSWWATRTTGSLDPSDIRASGVYRVQFTLYQDGVLQDIKIVPFRAVRTVIDQR